ncbi:collagenase-like [Drosophila serrata]|uniref:collagenase-like n=1 Tax=Drosophila serrata TaxID=7274 RepID=UPI000A1D04E8|nr:collagenase-like [Drosophila serrata]
MVAIRNETKFRCAGSLIHREFVLTAAQCIEGQRSLYVMLGAKDLLHPLITVAVKQAFVHRSFSRENRLNDIALVMLSHSVDYTDYVRPICILRNAESKDDVDKIRYLKTFGWGIGTDVKMSYNLNLDIRIQRFDRNYCGNKSEESSFCGGPTNEGFCAGDIGGAVSHYLKLDDKMHPVQIGIVSSGKCGGARPYVDVTSYAVWIERLIRTYDEPKSAPVTNNQVPKTPATDEMPLFRDCGETYLTANIYGPEFMAKGVMITYHESDSLILGFFQEIEIDSVYKHPEVHKTDIALLKLSSGLIPESTTN